MEDFMPTDHLKVLALAASCLLITACPTTSADTDASNDTSTANSRDGSSSMDLTTESPDAGLACCPIGFDLYACQEPDGRAGFACHNPAMGCASSQTCGQGCDSQVSGRCACVQTDLCIRGDHFDTTLCKCVPDQDAGTVFDTNPACIDAVLCILGDHFDATLCKCVPDREAGTVNDTNPVCIDTVLCIRGDHFDATLCKCVADP
jgi:hypothetical protein